MSEKEQRADVAGVPDLSETIRTGEVAGVLVEGSWPEERWWEQFDSEVLTGWIEEAFRANPDLVAVEKRVEAARQKARVVRSKLFPLLFFDADDNIAYFSENGLLHAYNPSLPLNGYQVDLSLSFRYEFDFWGKYRNLFRSALGQAAAEEAEYRQAKLVLSTSLAQSYFALLVSIQKKELYQTLCRIAENRTRLQKLLSDGALSSKLPVLLDEEKLLEATQNLAAIEEQIAEETHLINILRGKGPDEDLGWKETSPKPFGTVTIPKYLSADLMARRPDLAAKISRMQALAHEVGAAKADFFPNVNLVALAGLQSLSFSNLFTSGSKTGSVDPALHLPLFTAGAIRANLREKKALFDQAVFEYNALILRSVQEVADLIVNINTAAAQEKMQQESLAAARKRLSLISNRKASGLDSAFSVLDAEEEVANRSLGSLTLLYTEYACAVKLIKSLGGGYQTPGTGYEEGHDGS